METFANFGVPLSRAQGRVVGGKTNKKGKAKKWCAPDTWHWRGAVRMVGYKELQEGLAEQKGDVNKMIVCFRNRTNAVIPIG